MAHNDSKRGASARAASVARRNARNVKRGAASLTRSGRARRAQ